MSSIDFFFILHDINENGFHHLYVWFKTTTGTEELQIIRKLLFLNRLCPDILL